VEALQLAEVGLAERVAVDGEEGLVEPLGGEADGAPGPERLVLGLVLEPQSLPLLAEVVLDLGREVAAREHGALDAVAAQVLEGEREQRPVDERQHVLPRALGQRAEPGAEAADEDDRGQRQCPTR
jgi:hypothetical protein